MKMNFFRKDLYYIISAEFNITVEKAKEICQIIQKESDHNSPHCLAIAQAILKIGKLPLSEDYPKVISKANTLIAEANEFNKKHIRKKKISGTVKFKKEKLKNYFSEPYVKYHLDQNTVRLNRCKFCGAIAVSGSDTCYSCQ